MIINDISISAVAIMWCENIYDSIGSKVTGPASTTGAVAKLIIKGSAKFQLEVYENQDVISPHQCL